MTLEEHARRYPDVWHRFNPRETLVRYAWYLVPVIREAMPGLEAEDIYLLALGEILERWGEGDPRGRPRACRCLDALGIPISEEIRSSFGHERIDSSVRIIPRLRIAVLGELPLPGLYHVDRTFSLSDSWRWQAA